MSAGSSRGAIARTLHVLHRVEDATLALLLGSMILLAPLQMFLRNFFDASIPWADPLIRVLVLWVGLLGAVAASRTNRHISIDVLSRALPTRTRAGVSIATSLFTTIVAGLVAYHSGRFVATEFEYGSVAFSGIPAWMCEVIIPVAFGVIALRYLFNTLSNIAVLFRPKGDSE
jgi:TRAP-type C4-dicarboxylate transport system permease small subunit